MDFMNGSGEILKHGSKLPHWQQGEVMQFVTFRLRDALPGHLVGKWKDDRAAWVACHPQPWTEETESEYHRRFSRKLDEWLDAGSGSCLLRDRTRRTLLEDVLMRYQGERVDHQCWVIMPNHVHLLFKPLVRMELLIKAWKGTSARRIGQGSVWQKNYRDTMIRDAGHFANAVRYIRRNPVKLPAGAFSLWQNERAAAV